MSEADPNAAALLQDLMRAGSSYPARRYFIPIERGGGIHFIRDPFDRLFNKAFYEALDEIFGPTVSAPFP
jgi:hypothetical protein